MKRILSILTILFCLCLPIATHSIMCPPPGDPGGDWIFPGGFCDNILLVCPTSEYTTITEAMAAAEAWDTILVAEGTYSEAVTFTGDNITLRAFGSAENTIITQGAGTTMSFSTYSGCTVDGFTVSLTAADNTNDEVIFSHNNDTDDYNTVKNCIIDVKNKDATTFGLYGIRITDGNFRLINNTITVWQTADAAVYAIWNSVAHIFECRENTIFVNQDATGAFLTVAIAHAAGAGGIMYCLQNTITMDSEHTGGSIGHVVYAHARLNYVNENIINAVGAAGKMYGLFTGDSDTAYYISNFINVTTTDSDGEWANFSVGTGISHAHGNTIIGDGILTTGGTIYLGTNLINGITTAGTLSGTLKRYYPAILNDNSSPHELTIAECSNTVITTQGWNGTSDITFVLPDISSYDGSEGVLKGKFLDNVGAAAHDLYIDPDGSTQIVLDGTITGVDGDRIWFENITIYSSIAFHSEYDPTLGGYWVFDSINGIAADFGS